ERDDLLEELEASKCENRALQQAYDEAGGALCERYGEANRQRELVHLSVSLCRVYGTVAVQLFFVLSLARKHDDVSNVNVSNIVSDDRFSDVEMGPSLQKDADGQLQFSFRDFRYLNVQSNIMKSATNLVLMPSAFTLAFGILSDSRPIFGFRRRPFMGGGFLLVWASFIILIGLGLPDPCFCFVDAWTRRPLATRKLRMPTVANLGCVAATAAAQGLAVEYAKAEPQEIRGRT
ncbi:unnamed protein product, partial [Symbiodinium sp. CCMP2456]